MTRVTYFTLAFCAAVVFSASQSSAIVVFQSGFEYAAEPSSATIGNDAANLNGAIGQVGTFSGAIPNGAGGQFAPNLMGFENNPNGGRLLWVDRPVSDGTFNANLDRDMTFTLGGSVSFDLGTRRTQGNNNKDYFITGFDDANNESFRLRVRARSNNNNQERLNAVVNGGTLITDFTIVSGNEDGPNDLPNTGGPPFTADDLANIKLNLTSSGYNIEFMRGNLFYITDELAYNGSASSLDRIEFTFAGGGNDGLRSGYILDNLVVEAITPEPTTALLALFGVSAMGLRRRRVA